VKIADKNIADPSLLVTRHGPYYLYTTGPGGIAVYTSSRSGGGYRYDRTISFTGYSAQWAPHVVYNSGRYVLFFTALSKNNRKHDNKTHCVYVAASSTPDRGYRAYSALKCDANPHDEAIDPTTYASAQSGHYLVWRHGRVIPHSLPINCQILAQSITYHSTGKPATLTVGKHAHALTPVLKDLIEAPSLIYRNRQLWMFVSRAAFNTPTGSTAYRTQVWSGPKLGMLRKRRNIMTSGTKYGHGPDGAEVSLINGTTYIAYEYIAEGPKPLVRHADLATVSWKTKVPSVH